MAGLGWGKRDDSTREERAAWKANAERQMNGDNSADSADENDDDDATPRHRRARRPR